VIQQLEILNIGTRDRLASCEDGGSNDPQSDAKDRMRDIETLEMAIDHGTCLHARDEVPEVVLV
jgi:hypothetical protein